MKTKKFIRLQSEKYDINENSRSFEWGLGTIEYAMYDALTNMIDTQIDPYTGELNPRFQELRDELMELDLNWDNMDPKISKRLAELYDEWKPPHSLILDGVSCYSFENEQEAAKKLFDYFELRNPSALKDEHYYILIFEGEELPYKGHNGEDVAVWVRDIERVPTKEFFARYGIEISGD